MRVSIFVGDITDVQVDALCTSTNPRLSLVLGTGAAVRGCGGYEILRACEEIVRMEGILPPGSARATTAGSLPHKVVIHCVASDARHQSSDLIVETCVRNALSCADAGRLPKCRHAGLRLRTCELQIPSRARGDGPRVAGLRLCNRPCSIGGLRSGTGRRGSCDCLRCDAPRGSNRAIADLGFGPVILVVRRQRSFHLVAASSLLAAGIRAETGTRAPICSYSALKCRSG